MKAQELLPPKDFKKLQKGVGFVLGYLYTDVQTPIYKMHPELEPPELRK
jgi:hypothetical protein